MRNFLRAFSALCLVWTIVLIFGRDLITTPAQQTSLAQSMAHGQAASFFVLAFLFFRASNEAKPNTPVIVGAAIFAVLRVTTDLYDLLVLVDSVNGLVSLLDLVLCVGLAVGIIEMLPRTLNPQAQNEKKAEG